MKSENRRQRRLSNVLQEEMSTIFQREQSLQIGNELVTITRVFVTKDLAIARFYLSIYNTDDREAVLKHIRMNAKPIRKVLAGRIRHQVRKIPQLEFYPDDTLDKAFRLENIFKEIGEEDKNDDNPDSA